MAEFFDIFKPTLDTVAPQENTFVKGDVRISVLSPSLIRVEKRGKDAFCDDATQAVVCRNFASPEFTKRENGIKTLIKTSVAEFFIDTVTARVEYVKIGDKKISDFSSGNLKGTKRTLDQSFGRVSLSDGIISKNGAYLLHDDNSLIIEKDGLIRRKNPDRADTYCFAYGTNYRRGLYDYYCLTGFPPLIPRFAFGNWWSRYKAYTQSEYLSLMERFRKKKIPLTVATVDMDWHWVDLKSQFGDLAKMKSRSKSLSDVFNNAVYKGGWTGYSWNTELFPKPDEFLQTLQDSNLKVTLNLHPAQGVRFFEDAYREFAEFMGIDPESGQTIEFDITDKKFIEGYFRFLHEPMEKAGVDFWWIDWQQGTKTAVEGLDPLWALNHYHSLWSGRDKSRRPLILSRFAGTGSQRYPLGFSGDTAQNWDVLDFQPYFTNTASNIGYSWWSHDIGGHHFGKKDDELYLRWVQYGVFSPIMRLHSTSNEFMGKEPWNYSSEIEHYTTELLRLRHRLIPYIYSVNYQTHTQGRALCEPMYYEYPEKDEAYDCPNEYFFGSELIVCPITEPVDKNTRMASALVWFPEGRYTDVFTGRIYKGECFVRLFRDIACFPVLAKEGAIIPMYPEALTNDIKNPEVLEIQLYRGNGCFTLYEDDGESMAYKDGKYAKTEFEIRETDNRLIFKISPAKGDISVIPEKRSYILNFRDVVSADVNLKCGSENRVKPEISDENGILRVEVKEISPEKEVEICLENVKVLENENMRDLQINTVSKYQMSNNKKKVIFTDYVNGKKAMPVSIKDCYRLPLEEIEEMFKG